MHRNLIVLCLLLCSAEASPQKTAPPAPSTDQRRLEFNIAGPAGDTVYLANCYGNRLYYADTCVADPKGRVVFNSKNGYKAGVYAVVIPGPKYFEMIVNEPEVIMNSDKADLHGKLMVKQSVENQLFTDYITLLNGTNKASEALSHSSPMKKDALKFTKK